MLAVRALEAHYGDTQVLYGVSFDVGVGQVVQAPGWCPRAGRFSPT